LKIAGVVNNYNEALEIEDIVKVFLIEKRIFKLSSLSKGKNNKNIDSSDINISSSSDIKYSPISNGKVLQNKNDEESRPVFNVRGLF
jgi:hypothetical protein